MEWLSDLRTLRRVAAGLKLADPHPPRCRWTDPLRGRSHALLVMDDHRHHRCPRYSLAVDYLQTLSWP